MSYRRGETRWFAFYLVVKTAGGSLPAALRGPGPGRCPVKPAGSTRGRATEDAANATESDRARMHRRQARSR
ncbi:hypothetical protein POSPLADRAFT_1040944 [Postia placenta MAD-698-R-SB12]|uniref:Uncharacterized protein n=1 Tax=Postia placenta MAD-698-R-SB12 TaxID=670580 RepID=A0A1X6MSB1_9APHY|nr:hypothetical protein POSPLADRAFT_1040944 [Postia placenta MAD-698-R-SB12]OSX59268.1 hypothetical protein POSPLADRAFT_1040944 [Postia placenta MAD-698-R-SB12]